jgi:hypothetical protein
MAVILSNARDEAQRARGVRHETERDSRRRLQHVGSSLAFIRVNADGRAGQLERWPLSPLVPCGEREKNYSGGGVTQGGTRASLALGYYQAIPTGFQDGSLRSQEIDCTVQGVVQGRAIITDESFIICMACA